MDPHDRNQGLTTEQHSGKFAGLPSSRGQTGRELKPAAFHVFKTDNSRSLFSRVCLIIIFQPVHERTTGSD